MKYSLRSLMLVVALGPPVLAVTWLIGSRAISEYRERQAEQEWTDVGGPGTVAEFTTSGCFVDEDDSPAADNELTNTSSGDAP